MRRLLVRSGLTLLAVLLVASSVWGAVWWVRYPRVPDVAKVDVGAAIDFIGTDDFNRMTEAHRTRYAKAVAERLREKSFKDLLGLAMNGGPSRRRAAENVNRLKAKDDVAGAFLRVFLDKFYDLPPGDRDQYLTVWALAESFGRRGSGGGPVPFARGPATRPAGPGAAGDAKPARPRLPTPDQLENGMANFLAHQPPRTCAQMGELMNSMRRKRESLGIKQP